MSAHLTAPHAEQIINLFAIAIPHDLLASQFLEMVFAYPTAASDVVYMLG